MNNVNSDGPAKKPYSTPVLQVYGDLKAITKNLDVGSQIGDGGSNSMHQGTTP